MRWHPSIRLQIFFAITLVASLIMAGFGFLVVERVGMRANALAHRAALEDARLISLIASRGLDSSEGRDNAGAPSGRDRSRSFHRAIAALRASGALFHFSSGEETFTRVEFFNSRAELVFDSAVAQIERTPAAVQDPDVRAALSGVPIEEPILDGTNLVSACLPIRKGVQVVGAVRVVKPSLGVRSILADLAPEVLFLALGFVALALLMALLVGSLVSLPLKKLTYATQKIAQGNRTHVLPDPIGREVYELNQAFEDMRRELLDKNRILDLSQDLSHELKNPLAAIRSLTETLEAGAMNDPAVASRLLRRITQASARLDALVADLLDLARLEASGVDRSSKLDLADIVAKALAQVQEGRPQPARIEVQQKEDIFCYGDPVWLRRAVVNLMTNAVAAGTQPDHGVTVRITRMRSGIALAVCNPGEIPPGLRHNLFERFVSRQPEGTGLGLAIVRSVAEAHGGEVSLHRAGPPTVEIVLRIEG